MRCPACNANRTVPHKMGTLKEGQDMIGRICKVCKAHWLGELFKNKELNDALPQMSV
jgi:hypothetical protein